MIYSEKYGGYIVDVPDMDFIRCDGRVFSDDELNSVQYSQTNNSLTINGGRYAFPLAIIDTGKELTVTVETSKFTMSMFEMAYATNMTIADRGVVQSGRYEVKEGLKVTLPFEVMAKSVKIYGLEETTGELVAGKFTVAITASTADTAGETVIAFATGDALKGDFVSIAYRRRGVDIAVVAQTSTGTTARGELWLHYWIRSAGVDCTESAIKGCAHLHLYRVRVSETPGFNNSWKSASTNSFTFVSLDPKRPDHKISEILYEELGEDEAITNESGNVVDWEADDE